MNRIAILLALTLWFIITCNCHFEITYDGSTSKTAVDEVNIIFSLDGIHDQQRCVQFSQDDTHTIADVVKELTLLSTNSYYAKSATAVYYHDPDLQAPLPVNLIIAVQTNLVDIKSGLKELDKLIKKEFPSQRFKHGGKIILDEIRVVVKKAAVQAEPRESNRRERI